MSIRAFLMILVMAAVGAAQNIYYFDFDGGDDSTGTGTKAAPWKTITKLNATAVAGDICFLQAGDTFVVRLRPAAPDITVASYGTANSGRATITSTANDQSAWGEQVRLTFKDLELTGDVDGLYVEGDITGFAGINLDAHTNSQNGFNSGTSAEGHAIFLGCSFDDNSFDGFGTRGSMTAYVNGGTISGNDEDGASPHNTSTLWLDGVAITGGTTAECVHVFNVNANTYIDRCIITAVDDDCVRVEHQSGNTTGTCYVRNSILVLPASGMAANSAVFQLVGTNSPSLVVDSCTVGILNAGANDCWGMRYSSSAQTLTVTNTAFHAVDDVDNFYFSSSTATLTGVTLAYNRFVGLTTQAAPYDLSTGDVAFAAFEAAVGSTSTSEIASLGIVDDTDWSDAANIALTPESQLRGVGVKQSISLTDDYTAGSRRQDRLWDIGARSAEPVVVTYATTPIDGETFKHYTAGADLHKAWGIAVDPTYLDLTNFEPTLAARRSGGMRRLVLTSPTAVTAKIALGYGATPADVDSTLGSYESDAITVNLSSTPVEIWSYRPITSIEAVASSQVTGVSIWGLKDL